MSRNASSLAQRCSSTESPRRWWSGSVPVAGWSSGSTVPRRAAVELQVRRSELPEPEPGAYYVFQLVGLEVEEEAGRSLGTVTDVAPGIANDVLELDSGLALPLVEACVREVDLKRRRILVAPGFAPRD